VKLFEPRFECYAFLSVLCFVWQNVIVVRITVHYSFSAATLSECLSIQISRNLYFIFLWAHPLVALRKIHKFREMKNADCAKSQFCFFTFSAAAFCPPLLSLFSFCRWNCCYDIFMKNFKFTIGIGQHTQAFLPSPLPTNCLPAFQGKCVRK